MGSCCSTDDYPVYVEPPAVHPVPIGFNPPPSAPYVDAAPMMHHNHPPPPHYQPHYHAPPQYDSAGYKWIPTVAGSSVPHTAVIGGRDIDGTDIYVGRAYHEGDMLPAKVIPQKDVAYVCHGGQEHPKHSFEVRFSMYLCSLSFGDTFAIMRG